MGPYGSYWGNCLLRGGQANVGNIVEPSQLSLEHKVHGSIGRGSQVTVWEMIRSLGHPVSKFAIVWRQAS